MGLGEKKAEPNNLLDFMLQIGPRTKNLLLGTATPIQTEVSELWDLLRILNAGADFVLGRESFRHWADWERALPVVKGDEIPADERDAWEWLRNPLPPGDEEPTFATLRLQLGLPDNAFFTDRGFGSLGYSEQQAVAQTLAPGFFREHNPIVRHTVLRRRQTLEDAGLLERVGVDIHPTRKAQPATYRGVGFDGLGLLTNHPFDLAYKAAEAFTAALKQRTKAAGFMKTLLLQRICSSFASGQATAEKMLRREVARRRGRGTTARRAPAHSDACRGSSPAHDRRGAVAAGSARSEARRRSLLPHRASHRRENLAGARLHRLQPVLRHRILGWRGTGEGTARRTRRRLRRRRQERHVSGTTTSRRSSARRSRRQSRSGKIRLVVATDAACEGLNLQTLGTLINVDLPWNPSRLEQRLGRIKRFGQARRTVDMLNLVYHDTQDEKVYQVLSRRMKDRYDIFGGLPDTIEDDWIESVEKLEEMMDEYIHLRQKARDVFEMRYQETIDPDKDRWELCSRVLARKDVIEKLSESW